MTDLPIMPDDWSFIPGPLHSPISCDLATDHLDLAKDIILSSGSHYSSRWTSGSGQVSLRWNDNGANGHVPILEVTDTDEVDDYGHPIGEPYLEVSIPWGSTLYKKASPKNNLAMANAMIDLVLSAIDTCGSQTYLPETRSEQIFDAIQSLAGNRLTSSNEPLSLFSLRLPTPWSPVQCTRHHDPDGQILLTLVQQRIITALSPKVVMLNAHMSNNGRIFLHLSAPSWVGDRPLNPIQAMRSLATMPAALKEVFS